MKKEIAKNLAIAFGMGLLASGMVVSAYHFGYVKRKKGLNGKTAEKKNPEDSKKG